MKLHGVEISTKNKGRNQPVAKGSCLCGAVRYSVHGPLAHVSPCHCSQCRKQSGHFAAYVQIEDRDDIQIEGEDRVSWYEASDLASRGFCKVCGSQLFWVPNPETTGRRSWDVTGGTLDTPSGIKCDMHIFVADKGDYYDIADGLPQHDTYPEKGEHFAAADLLDGS